MIAVFSGTGNTLAVARRLSGTLGDRVVPMDVAASSPTLSLQPGERLIWCFPIYSWGVPPVVEEYIRRVDCPEGTSVPHYMVCTCGDDTGYADHQWRRLLRRRGWEARSAFSVQMPNTYVTMKGFDTDSPEVETAKLAKMPGAVRQIAGDIADGAPSRMVRGKFPWIKSSLIRAWFVRFAMSPKPFRPSQACISCGKCARVCPMYNITMAEKRPHWGSMCALCLACYHACPAHAVQYGKETASKGQYNHFLQHTN